MNESQKERLVKQLIENDYNSIEVPDPTASWNCVYVQLQKRKRMKKWSKRIRIASAIVILVVAIETAMTADIPKTHAHVSTLFRDVKERLVEYFFNRND